MCYSLDTGNAILTNHLTGIKIRLGEYEMKLLHELINNHGVIISTETLIMSVWGHKFVSRGSLTKAICTLRYILQDRPPYKMILNKPRKGYCLPSSVLSHFQVVAPVCQSGCQEK